MSKVEIEKAHVAVLDCMRVALEKIAVAMVSFLVGFVVGVLVILNISEKIAG